MIHARELDSIRFDSILYRLVIEFIVNRRVDAYRRRVGRDRRTHVCDGDGAHKVVEKLVLGERLLERQQLPEYDAERVHVWWRGGRACDVRFQTPHKDRCEFTQRGRETVVDRYKKNDKLSIRLAPAFSLNGSLRITSGAILRTNERTNVIIEFYQ
jgi:hypothetical protein